MRRRLACLILLALAACAPAAPLETEITVSTTAHSSATPALTRTLSTPVPSASPSPAAASTAAAPVQTPSPTPVCGAGWCSVTGHFFLHAPIAGSYGEQVDPTYRYSSTDGGQRVPHTGVEFQAPEGETVRAAGDGRVLQAGENTGSQFASLGEEYGNLVIIRHQFTAWPGPIYTLYGHLSRVDVSAGDWVKAGQQIGRVGDTGIATGPHLHFEVRVGAQMLTQNPELWLLPFLQPGDEQDGAIAGRVVDQDGKLLEMHDIDLKRQGDPGNPAPLPVYLQSYATTSLPVDATWNENFAAGNLVPGVYRITTIIDGRLDTRDVTVFPGRLTLVDFGPATAPTSSDGE